MAIVGYESNQVQLGNTYILEKIISNIGNPFQVMKTENGDKLVPITWAYNHHCEAYLTGKYSKMFLEKFPDPKPNSKIPIYQWFGEGNGGEFR